MSELLQTSHARTPEELDEEVRRILRSRTRRSFLTGGVASLAAYGAYEWIYRAPQVDMLQRPLRDMHEVNRGLINGIFRQGVLAPTYPLSAVDGLRVNGDYGIDENLQMSSWRLQLLGLEQPQRYKQFTPDVDLWEYKSTPPDMSALFGKKDAAPDPKSSAADRKGNGKPEAKPEAAKKDDGSSAGAIPHITESTTVAADPSAKPGVLLSMDDLRRLPYTEQITQFKCVEGWSQIIRWGGVRFSDFIRAYPPANVDGAPPKFVTMETYNGEYNASYDLQSLMHPQTLICTTMHGKPLEFAHGAPIRMAMPLKYGYKQIKAIASMEYSNVRTPDYWEKLGYDWYAGL